MEGERRKRKLENNNELEESEEEKLEKFYALIRSTKDARDRLANPKDKADKKDDFIEKDKGIWKPTFQPEDFFYDYQQGGFRSKQNPPDPSPSTSAKHDDVVQVADKHPPHQANAPAPAPAPQTVDDDDEKANERLDLNLSL